MDRREFLKLTVISSIGLFLPCNMGLFLRSTYASENIGLVVAKGESPSKITRAAIDAFGGIQGFIGKGDIVVVKPNIGWDRLPEHAANTNPEVVAEVVRLCFEAGAKKVKIFDRSVNDQRRCYVQSGIAPMAKALGAEVTYVDDRKFKEMKLNGQVLKTWPLYTEIFEADKVINIPIAKHHGLAKITMAMKNWMGVMGGSRWQIHQKLDQSLVDISMAIQPTLTVLDAVRILVTNGPQGGNLSDVRRLNTVIVGKDQVAVDAFGATLFGMEGNEIGYIRIASETGLGTMDLSKINIKRITA
ncbi:MAG: DUF362 domain-containing protein [Thermodesulfobacteriota bacterium]|nr:DUF362 domain-containing protein [Thermodesulfobacteriota bacterium]